MTQQDLHKKAVLCARWINENHESIRFNNCKADWPNNPENWWMKSRLREASEMDTYYGHCSDEELIEEAVHLGFKGVEG